MQGTISKYNAAQRYGFIACERGEAFFHASTFLDDIPPCSGMKVYFEYVETEKGGIAKNISIFDTKERSSNLFPTVSNQPQTREPQYKGQYNQNAQYNQQTQYNQQPQYNQQTTYQQPQYSQQDNSQPQKPVYIKIGAARVQLNMIERYGIKDYFDDELRSLEADLRLAKEFLDGYYADDYEKHNYNKAKKELEAYKKSNEYKINKNDQVLYIHLTNGEHLNFRQSRCDFDIYEALQRLDRYLCG